MYAKNYQELPSQNLRQYQQGLEAGFERLSVKERGIVAYILLDLVEQALESIEGESFVKGLNIAARLQFLSYAAERVQDGGVVRKN
jgi:hypothetical protein